MSPEEIAARSLTKTHPDLARDWHPNNDRTPDQVTAGSGYRAQWRCTTLVQWPDGTTQPCNHEWATKVALRGTCGTGCPACAGKAAADWNRLDRTHPHLAADWNDPRDISTVPAGSAYRAQWRCSICNHEWVKPVEKRSQSGYGCPGCAGYAVTATNNLAVTHPELALDWHADNPGLPRDYVAGSNVRLRWSCRAERRLDGVIAPCGYVWEATPNTRTQTNSGCAACAGAGVSWWNNLAAAYPSIAAEWHAEKNVVMASEVPHGRKAKAWWRCSTCSHEWQANIQNRTRHGRGCPACSGNVVTDQNRFSVRRPDLVGEWHPSNDRTPDEVSEGSDYLALWRCSIIVDDAGSRIACGHEWRTRVANRARLNNDCPACRPVRQSREEIHLAHELAIFLPEATEARTIPRAAIPGRPWAVDIAIPSLRIVVEYDGSYFHRTSAARDITKTNDLVAAGWRVLRVREAPLAFIGEHCVQSTPADYKGTANTVLVYLRDALGVTLPGLDPYLERIELQAEEPAREAIRRRRETRAALKQRTASRSTAA